MDHQYIEEHHIADLYVMEKLSAQDRDQFEAHYFDCETCAHRVEVMERFRRGLHGLSAEEIGRLRASDGDGGVGWRAWFRWRQPVVIGLAALLLLTVLPGIFLFRELERTRRELEQAEAASAQWQRQYEIEQQAARAWEEKLREAEHALAQLRAPSPPAAQTPRTERPDLTAARQPQINTPIFDLASVRSAGPDATGVSTEIALTPSTESFLLTLGLETEQKYETYRATIRTLKNRLVWRDSGLQPNEHQELTISFPSGFFEAGEYVLALEGLMSGDRPTPVANCSFRIIKSNER
jgi:type II secretory pathway pseudopilin PulG